MSTSKSKNNIVTGNQFAKRVVPLINNWDGYGYSNPKKLIQVLKSYTALLEQNPSILESTNVSTKLRKQVEEWSKLIDFNIGDSYQLYNPSTGEKFNKSDIKKSDYDDDFGDDDFGDGDEPFEYPNTILEKVVITPDEGGIRETQELHTCIELLLLAGASITEYAKRYCGFDMGFLSEIYSKTVGDFHLMLCDVDPKERKEKWIENNIAQTIIDNNCDATFVHNLFKETCCTTWDEEKEKKYKEEELFAQDVVVNKK